MLARLGRKTRLRRTAEDAVVDIQSGTWGILLSHRSLMTQAGVFDEVGGFSRSGSTATIRLCRRGRGAGYSVAQLKFLLR